MNCRLRIRSTCTRFSRATSKRSSRSISIRRSRKGFARCGSFTDAGSACSGKSSGRSLRSTRTWSRSTTPRTEGPRRCSWLGDLLLPLLDVLLRELLESRRSQTDLLSFGLRGIEGHPVAEDAPDKEESADSISRSAVNKDRTVFRVVGQLEELVGLLVLGPRLIRDRDVVVLQAQLLRFSFFRCGVEARFPRGTQIDDGRDALRLQFRQMRGRRLSSGAELSIELQEILNPRRGLLSKRSNAEDAQQQNRKDCLFHDSLLTLGTLRHRSRGVKPSVWYTAGHEPRNSSPQRDTCVLYVHLSCLFGAGFYRGITEPASCRRPAASN